jgi:hypothetical protein
MLLLIAAGARHFSLRTNNVTVGAGWCMWAGERLIFSAVAGGVNRKERRELFSPQHPPPLLGPWCAGRLYASTKANG